MYTSLELQIKCVFACTFCSFFVSVLLNSLNWWTPLWHYYTITLCFCCNTSALSWWPRGSITPCLSEYNWQFLKSHMRCFGLTLLWSGTEVILCRGESYSEGRTGSYIMFESVHVIPNKMCGDMHLYLTTSKLRCETGPFAVYRYKL